MLSGTPSISECVVLHVDECVPGSKRQKRVSFVALSPVLNPIQY
jgi:hypothetical protein